MCEEKCKQGKGDQECRGIQEEYHQMPPRVALSDWSSPNSFLALSFKIDSSSRSYDNNAPARPLFHSFT